MVPLGGLGDTLFNTSRHAVFGIVSRIRLTFWVNIVRLQEINLDYLVPEVQSYHFDMGSLSGKGEVDPADHFRQLYGGTAEVINPPCSDFIRGIK